MKTIALASTVLLALSLVSPATANYAKKAEEQTDYIQKNFYVASAKRYRPSFPINPKELPYDFMWGNGVQFSALVGAAQHNPAKYKQTLYDFREGLQTYWDPIAPVPGFNAYCSGPGGNDKYYDDNEWLVLGFAEAYEITRDPMFLKDAQNTQKFVLSGWDSKLGGGIYWKVDHRSKNTCSNGPAAASALRLVQVAKQADQLEWATKIRDWTNSRLLDADGLYWDNVNLDGKIEKTKWSYNTALMIYTNVLFGQLQKDKKSLTEARRLADAGLAAWTDPATGSLQKTEDAPRFTHLFCESLLRLYDVTKDVKYLNAVRRHASFAYRYARDPQGGYWNKWKMVTHAPDERKILIENASAARLFWLLAPYQDTDELLEAGKQAAGKGEDRKAEGLLRQAADSDAEAVEARYQLHNVLLCQKKTAAAAAEATILTGFAKDPAKRKSLQALGWKAE
ncbi:MAG: glycoside hydrolase family 76 protein [Armatimonadota bacterium]